jgi:hypothetical protein
MPRIALKDQAGKVRLAPGGRVLTVPDDANDPGCCCDASDAYVRVRDCCRDQQTSGGLWLPLDSRCSTPDGPFVFDPAAPARRTFRIPGTPDRCATIDLPATVRSRDEILASDPAAILLDPIPRVVDCAAADGCHQTPFCAPCDICCVYNRHAPVCGGNAHPPGHRCCECGKDVRVRLQFRRQTVGTIGGAVRFQFGRVNPDGSLCTACADVRLPDAIYENITTDAIMQYRWTCGRYTWERGEVFTRGIDSGDIGIPFFDRIRNSGVSHLPCVNSFNADWDNVGTGIVNYRDAEWGRNTPREPPCGRLWHEVESDVSNLALLWPFDSTSLPAYWQCGFSQNLTVPIEPLAYCADPDTGTPIFTRPRPVTIKSNLVQHAACKSGFAEYTSVYEGPLYYFGTPYEGLTRYFNSWRLQWSIETLEPCDTGASPCQTETGGTGSTFNRRPPFEPLDLRRLLEQDLGARDLLA